MSFITKHIRNSICLLFLYTLFCGATYPHFDPQNVEALYGEVLSVEVYSFADRPSPHTYVIVKESPSGEQIYVDLGPTWYLRAEGIRVAPHDLIDIRGYRVDVSGTPMIKASWVSVGGQTLLLRHPDGTPTWRVR